jgi:hypothetical protein
VLTDEEIDEIARLATEDRRSFDVWLVDVDYELTRLQQDAARDELEWEVLGCAVTGAFAVLIGAGVYYAFDRDPPWLISAAGATHEAMKFTTP